MPSRRDAIKAMVVATSATAAVPTQGTAQTTDPERPPAALVQLDTKKLKVLTADELAFVALLADLIIPRTDTPGASDAGVHLLIDRACSRDAKLAERFRAGLASLNQTAQQAHDKPFVRIANSQQVAMLQKLHDEKDPFFQLVKNQTVDLYYTTKEGLMTELGWNANTYLPEFKGCTHPEHQA